MKRTKKAVACCERGHSDRQRLLRVLAQNLLAGDVGAQQEMLRVGHQPGALRGESHRAAVQQGPPQVTFECGDVLGDRRLRETELRGGLRERAGAGDRRGLAGFDGIWVVPGSLYVDRDGVLHAVTVARTSGVPFLGTCGGFQHALLEYARSVCGLDVEHAEQPLDESAEPLIVALQCSLVGEEADVIVSAGTRAEQILGVGRRVERFFCSYGLDDRFRARLEEAGLVFSAVDDEGTARMVELPGHPFFLASLFQPELSSDTTWAHPLIHAFTDAALAGVKA